MIVDKHAKGKVDKVDEKVAVVVDANAIVNPRAVAVQQVSQYKRRQGIGLKQDLLVMLGYTTLAPPAVLASERRSNHACHTKVRFIVLPLADQLIYDGLLLGNAIELGDETRVIHHGPCVEESGEAKENSEQKIP